MEKYGLLFESVFKRKLTDNNTVGYLEEITKEHPYFSIAQFYLLRLSQKNLNGYKKQAKKTAVLFNNNHWLNFQLIESGYNSDQSIPAPEPTVEENIPVNFADKIHTEEIKDETPVTEIPPGEQTIEFNNTTGSPSEEETPVIESREETDSSVEDDIKPAIEKPVATIETSVETPSEQLQETNNDTDDVIKEEQPADNPVKEDTGEQEIFSKNEMPAAEVNNSLREEDIKPVEDEQRSITGTIIEEPVKHEPLLFEPLHTTDYFASVGIKLSEEEKTSGKLGKQLKSFTEWLKTMKKVHTEQLIQTTNPAEVETAGTESSIQKLAEKSNQENDVITEAMAEVLLQQGREDKAIEILEKLSLLNPGKSVYFAAKINQIKEK